MGKHATTMSALSRTAALLIAGVGVLAATTAAQAHDDKYWKRKGPPFVVPPGHVYYAAPVVYAPPPVVVYPAPVVYERMPMYYGPPPGLNINLNVPLR